MPRKSLGERPLSGAERQARQRAKAVERAALAQEAVAFVLALNPKLVDGKRALIALQQRLSAISWDN
jgi:hypothetical protein